MARPDDNITALRERIAAPLLGNVPRITGSNPSDAASFIELPSGD